jgi:hypothetical protein
MIQPGRRRFAQGLGSRALLLGGSRLNGAPWPARNDLVGPDFETCAISGRALW